MSHGKSLVFRAPAYPRPRTPPYNAGMTHQSAAETSKQIILLVGRVGETVPSYGRSRRRFLPQCCDREVTGVTRISVVVQSKEDRPGLCFSYYSRSTGRLIASESGFWRFFGEGDTSDDTQVLRAGRGCAMYRLVLERFRPKFINRFRLPWLWSRSSTVGRMHDSARLA